MPLADEPLSIPSQWARFYRGLGWQVVPALPPVEGEQWKRPALHWRGFEDELIAEETFAGWYGIGGKYAARPSMGVVTGAASGGLLVIDRDPKTDPEATRLANAYLKTIMATLPGANPRQVPKQLTGGGGDQYFFMCPPGWTPPTGKSPIGIDHRGQGGFVMVPPSPHLSGKAYAWERDPQQVPPPLLSAKACDLVDAFIAQYGRERTPGPATGERVTSVTTATPANELNEFGLRIDGREEAMTKLVWAIALDLRRLMHELDEPPPFGMIELEYQRGWEKFERECKSRLPADGRSNTERLEAEGRGPTLYRDKWQHVLAQWNDRLKAEAGEPPPARPSAAPAPTGPLFDPWEPWPVPPFPFDCLDEPWRGAAQHFASTIGVDAGAAAMAILTAVSGALDHQTRVFMDTHKGFAVSPRLWTILHGDPSTKKSPLMNAALKPLRALENELSGQYRRAMAEFKANPKGEQGDEPDKPTRYLSNDTTTEKLAEILSRQDRGILVEHDEMSGFIGSLERYGGGKGGSDRPFYLRAYNGGSHHVDRVARGELFISNLSISFLAGLQPGALDNKKGALTVDGLLQRFLFVIMGPAQYRQEAADPAPALAYADALAYLTTLRGVDFILSAEARQTLMDFGRQLHDERELWMSWGGPGFASWVGKLDGLVGSLALCLHLMGQRDRISLNTVGPDSATKAVRIMREFLIPHALAFFQSLENDGEAGVSEEQRQMASFILTSDKDRLTPGDFKAGIRAFRNIGVWEMRRRADLLVAGGWLDEEWSGAMLRAWTVVPGVREQFAERAKRELARKADLRRKMDADAERSRAQAGTSGNVPGAIQVQEDDDAS